MTDFNPLAGAVLGSAQAQRQIDAEKQRQLRRAQAVRKNVAAQEDGYEHQVESSEELHAVDDGGRGGDGSKNDGGRGDRRGKPDEKDHIDLKA